MPTSPDHLPAMHAALDQAWDAVDLPDGVTLEDTPHGITYLWRGDGYAGDGVTSRYAAVTVDWNGNGEVLLGRYVSPDDDRGYWETATPDPDRIATALRAALAWVADGDSA